MLYGLVRPLLFKLDAETSHNLTISALSVMGRVLPQHAAPESSPVELMGLRFPNRVGLAAGLDKNGEAVDGMARMGFGFLEIGTVTPRPQPGNPKPRIFRLPEVGGIINRMGFNNHGVGMLLTNVASCRYKGILGINIGKNFDTPIEQATEDYLVCLDQVHAHASYVTVNISSPNTANLRQLQGASELDELLGRLRARQNELNDQNGRVVPLVLKIAPDLDDEQITSIADTLRRHRIDGVIATNTTISREEIKEHPLASQQGGLSGAPLFEKSTEVVSRLVRALAGELPVIAAGGIMDGKSAQAKLQAGASLVQLYSGLIYRGPELVSECIAATR